MQKTVLAICFTLLASQIAAQTKSSEAVDSRIVAQVKLMEQGASIGSTHYTYLGARPKLPIRDAAGAIHPSSCNPHINLCKPKFDKKKILSLLTQLKEFHPDSNASHVAVYLNTDVLKDTEFINLLRKQLPKCQMYRESDDFLHSLIGGNSKSSDATKETR
jgi:hypothetical protein